MRGLFVTATDTGVGKTEVACALLRLARAAGVDAIGMKPAESGLVAGELADSERLRAACGDAEPLEAICPYRFSAPLAPAVAARVEGRTVSFERVLEAARALAGRHETVLVEGAGGLLVPLTDRESFADLALALGLPALVVARAGLGTVNHVALTIEALRARGIPLAGVVLNRTGAADDPSVPFNAAEIARVTGCEPIATLPWAGDIAKRASLIGSRLAGKIQF
jgi:dethiobiotin synthetase